MRPSPNELIFGIRALLRDAVGPALQSPEAGAALKRVMAALRDTDWNEAGFALLAENTRLLALLGEIDAWLAARNAADPPRARIASIRASASTVASYAAASDVNLACRNALAACVDASPEDAGAMRARIAAALLAIIEARMDGR